MTPVKRRSRDSATLERVAENFATLFSVGRLPLAPGTWGSLVTAVALFPLTFSPALLGIALGILGVVAVWSSGVVEARARTRDPGHIVIDEALGMGIVIAVCPPGSLVAIALGFVLFRAFDILKPWPLRRLERLPGGLGIVADDVGAGLYTAALLQITRLF